MFSVFQQFAFKVVGQDRGTQRHAGKVVDVHESKLRRCLRAIAAEHIRWGWRMAYRLLRQEGWRVNPKRVRRLWLEEGIQRATPRKLERARPADVSVQCHQAKHPHKVWAMEFQLDATVSRVNQADVRINLIVAGQIAHPLRTWCKNSGTATAFIEPGSLWQHGFVESSNCRFRDEFLNTELFVTVTEQQGLANRWFWEYSYLRSH